MLTAIIPAAGASRRMQGANKLFMSIAGQPVLTRTLLSLKGLVDEFIILCKAGEEDEYRKAIAGAITEYTLIPGGNTRQDSVYAGLLLSKGDYVLIHDGCRPLASRELIQSVIAAAKSQGAAIPATPVTDTIKVVEGGAVQGTMDRRTLAAVQTPQVFSRALLLAAYEQASPATKAKATDDAFLVEQLGQPVTVVPGEDTNIKITYPKDIFTLGVSKEIIRTGLGYDVHRFAAARKLILGGITIPFSRGLLGHSDADVLIHAVIDALLGAAGLGDIGTHFPDSDQKWAGADSRCLLARVGEMLAAKSMRIINIDGVIIAQAPRLSPYFFEMEASIAGALGIDAGQVNIKASTTEGLGFIGHGEGIAAQSICTIALAGNRRKR